MRPWTIELHVAQNDGTVHGSGSHDKTGRHCLATDPNGKLDITRQAGYWLRDENGEVTKKIPHLCWDGCMFANAVMMDPKTWDDILAAMIAINPFSLSMAFRKFRRTSSQLRTWNCRRCSGQFMRRVAVWA